MRQVSVQEAKTQLSALLKDVERGESVTIANWHKPVAQLVPISSVTQEKQEPTGFLAKRGVKFTVPHDFDSYRQDEFISLFEGENHH